MEKKQNNVRAVKVLSCTGKKIVRYGYILVAALAMCSCASSNTHEAKGNLAETVQRPEKIVVDYDSMYFSTENIVEEFEAGSTAHYVIYNDADAGMDNEVIRLTPKSYLKVLNAISCQRKLTGTLKAVRPYESVEYELVIDEKPVQNTESLQCMVALKENVK